MEDDRSSNPAVLIRNPLVADGAAIWKLVEDVGVLDHNSSYAYLLLCRDFGDTCVVAERDGRLHGFITGYRPPRESDTLFVWQVGVSPAARGEGLASRLLDELLRTEGCRGVRFLETTVTPSNEASRAMFASLARRLNTDMTESAGFTSELFPDPDHEPERRLRIGPFEVGAA
jgi:L-2,4-diaminobutyric acid acetyltransferase